MKRLFKVLAGSALAVVVLAGVLDVVLPGIVQKQAQQWVATHTGRTLQIEGISINPLTLQVEIRGLRLSEPGSKDLFAGFQSLRLNFSARSLLGRGLIVDEVDLTSPYLRIVRTGPRSFNFSDLLNVGGPDKKGAGGKPLQFSINNIRISDGSIDLLDRTVPGGIAHTVRDLNLRIPFIGNTPYLADKYVTPALSARIDSAPFHFEGELKPFAEAVEASVRVKIDRLALPHYFASLPVALPVKVAFGNLATDLKVTYRASVKEKPRLTIAGNLTLSVLLLKDHAGRPLLSVPLMLATIAPSQIFSKDIVLKALTVYGAEAWLSRDAGGTWNFARLAGTSSAPRHPSAASPTAGRVTIDTIRLLEGKVHFDDQVPPGGFRAEIENIHLEVGRFSTVAGNAVPFKLSLATARRVQGIASGSVTLQPLSVRVAAGLDNLPIEAYYPYLAGELAAAPAGRLSASTAVALDDGDLRLNDLAVAVKQLEVPFPGGDGFRLRRFSLGGGAVDLKSRKISVASVAFDDGTLRFSRGADGALSPLGVLRRRPQATASAAAPAVAAPPFSYKVGTISGQGLTIRFTDGTKSPAAAFALRDVHFKIDDISGPAPAPCSFDLAAAYGPNGTIAATGHAVASPLRLDGAVSLRRIPLAGFMPYVPKTVRLVVTGGTLDAQMGVDLRQQAAGFAGSYHGRLGVRNFSSIDAADRHKLLSWESLQFDQVQGALAPFALRVGQVSLSDYRARVIVDPDGRLNLQKLIGGPEKPASPASKSVATPAGSPPDIRVADVTLQGGVLSFADHHLSPSFETTMYNLGGRVSGLSSASEAMADVDLRGNLENQSPLRITGQLNPLRGDLALDLKIRFNDIELSPLTPYSATYLGYTVARGKLFLNLTYHIAKGHLDSQNRVFIDQFTFGKSVESPKATHLPVRLAIALLKDRRGEIHLDLPVTGSTTDPQFSVFSVAMHMLRNLVVKAATAPFALLASMFGAGQEDFSTIHFPYGSASLQQPERDKLLKLAKMLDDRPALKLKVMGYVDKSKDPEGYRNQHLLVLMQREKLREMIKAGKAPANAESRTMQIAPAEYSALLKKVYRKADFPKPRNFIGMVKNLPDAEMKKLLLANTVVGNAQLQTLASERAMAVKQFLIGGGHLPATRIFLERTDIFKAPDKEGESGSRVTFGIATD